ncbi:MAG: glycosyl hydrolase-related protein [Clostridia bacterium]|nr:glycosyl hydrolase-related protein [Clostridia bacterium]
MEVYTCRTVDKVKRLYGEYKKFLYNKVAKLDCEISEIPAPENTPEARSKFYAEKPENGWHSVNDGDIWGGEFCYAWFRSKFTVPKELDGKKLLIKPDVGLVEGLLFLNGKPSGMFDYCHDIPSKFRLHEVQPLTLNAKAGEKFDIAVECYAGHKVLGNNPEENGETTEWSFYPADFVRTFNSFEVVVCDEAVAKFLMLHRTVAQIIDCYDNNTATYASAVNAFCEIFKILPCHPQEVSFDWHPALEKANKILQGVTDRKSAEGEEFGYVGLIGHSHLDTAWHWPVRETLHKAARTFSNALRLMENYPDYHFIQSSVVYDYWMKKYYPDIYEGIKKRTAEGRWEPNGGAWVECDNNMPSGEYVIRQFLYGQRFLKENLDYMADCFWQPDTFGYSAAIPQILRGCGIKYFLTTKLSWNEANAFPHDSFIWEGIDGSRVLTHFNIIGAWPDIKGVKDALYNVKHPEVTDMKLLSYGFGDGGGGPSYSMLESEKIIKDMSGMPKLEQTTVSKFMKRLESTAKNLPVFSGELYLELHRGTLTQMHDIKRTNRLLEKAIHNYELLSVMLGITDGEMLDKAIKTLLVNQFHDILPGTCISDANDVAIYQNKRETDNLNRGMESFFNGEKTVKSIMNTLSFERKDQIVIKNSDFIPENCIIQQYVDIYGDKCTAVSGIKLPAFSLVNIKSGTPKTAECPFTVEGNCISTPFADIVMENGKIISYKTKSGREVTADKNIPLNTLYFGEDIPTYWDNWDIDYDQDLKMQPVRECVSSEVVSIGALQLRIRVKYAFGDSTLSQDVVFYADNPRIDFESVVNWNSPHSLLKVGFKVNVLSSDARFETQFGNIKRPTHENYATDKSQFEVCNHKWTDLSDTRFGVSILNDCKYGISVNGNDMRLTLHKGGCHPDTRGDKGTHRFTYSLLVHETAFNTESVIKPAYELNYPILQFDGTANIANIPSLLSVDADNVIIETVKPSEDNNGFIARLYETEGSFARCNIAIANNISKAFKTDMLEYNDEPIDIINNKILLDFKPFEIKTLRFVK